MNKEALKRIFEFLENKAEHNAPFKWKILNNEPITEEDLNVKGDLNLRSSEINSLPEGLKVVGNLVLNWSNITSLPEGLEVGGDLQVRNCKNLKSLPKVLKVGGDLYIYGTPINEIEDNDEILEMIKPGYIKGDIY